MQFNNFKEPGSKFVAGDLVADCLRGFIQWVEHLCAFSTWHPRQVWFYIVPLQYVGARTWFRPSLLQEAVVIHGVFTCCLLTPFLLFLILQ